VCISFSIKTRAIRAGNEPLFGICGSIAVFYQFLQFMKEVRTVFFAVQYYQSSLTPILGYIVLQSLTIKVFKFLTISHFTDDECVEAIRKYSKNR
jgi:hypothetical protein